MGATSTRRTPRKSPPARKSKSPSPSPKSKGSKSKSKSRSPSPALTPTAAEPEEEEELEMVSPRPAAEQGIDSIMSFFTDNSSTIIISFIIGVMFGIVVEELGNILKPDSLIGQYSDNIRSAEAEAAGSP